MEKEDSSDTRTIDDNHEEEEEPLPIVDEWMKRGEFLRQLRQLELEDQAEREEQNHVDSTQKQQQDAVYTLKNGKSVLVYDSFLQHQRYYDDLKHVDCHYIDYGNVRGDESNNNDCRLVIEQEKSLGKGGLCWDAAFILAEHLIRNYNEWNKSIYNNERTTTTLVELGGGTGLCGLMIAKAIDCHVRITDLPLLLPLMTRNVNRNFDTEHIIMDDEGDSGEHNVVSSTTDDDEDLNEILSLNAADETTTMAAAKQAHGIVSASVLQWGIPGDYKATYDVILGADVVASLYDPIALAETIHALCHAHSNVYISYKGRLTGPHEQFEEALENLFETVERIRPISRNRNPEVWILKATGKR